MSWAVPANRGEALFLQPSVAWCARHLGWVPRWVVGDMAYINLSAQRVLRERWQVALITRLRPDMRWRDPYDPQGTPRCTQGQRLEWLGYEAEGARQWFGVPTTAQLCSWCWEQGQCPRQFSYPASAHEILFGQVPSASNLARYLLEKVRPWVEPAQAYEKHRLGLADSFLNSLSLTWTLTLMADTVVLLRARALLSQPERTPLLGELAPKQLVFDWG